MIPALAFVGRYGRACLILGLVAGVFLPGIAAVLLPWLPWLVGALLFVSAYRIGPAQAFGSTKALPSTITRLAIYQLLMPGVALAIVTAFGWADTAFGLAFVLVLSGPSIVGSSNLAILLNKPPGSAMRLMIVGTALFPLTVIPILWALPAFPDLSAVLGAALRLILFVGLIAAAAFVARRRVELSAQKLKALDGVAALLLAVAVIGLMAAVGPTLSNDPGLLALWLAFACALNFGAQALAYLVSPGKQVGPAIIAGNRNIALFLVALPKDIIAEILIFIGVYQVPMYLTPVIMARLYRSGS